MGKINYILNIRRNLKKQIKVAQLIGSVSEISGYHHGEKSLEGTIINLAQDYVGSNNINLLEPIGILSLKSISKFNWKSDNSLSVKIHILISKFVNPISRSRKSLYLNPNYELKPRRSVRYAVTGG